MRDPVVSSQNVHQDEADDAEIDSLEEELEDEPEDEPEVVSVASTVKRRRRRSARQRGVPRKRTISTKKITTRELVLEWIRLGGEESAGTYWRPRTRSDCAKVPRPCPYVGCKHHNYLDVNPETGSINFNWPEHEPDTMPVASCSLDVAERGGITLEETGSIINLTRERVRQVEVRAIVTKLKPAALARDLHLIPIGERRDGPMADLENNVTESSPSDVTYQAG